MSEEAKMETATQALKMVEITNALKKAGFKRSEKLRSGRRQGSDRRKRLANLSHDGFQISNMSVYSTTSFIVSYTSGSWSDADTSELLNLCREELTSQGFICNDYTDRSFNVTGRI
jgi:hypothetical protein